MVQGILQNISKKKLTAIICTVLLAVLYFIPVEIPLKIAFPAIALALFSLGTAPWQISAMLFLSAGGDIAGDVGNMPLQIVFFALAHICLIMLFLGLGLKNKKKSRRAKSESTWLSVSLIVSIGILYFVLRKIAPWAPAGIIQKGVTIYACIICTMLFSAMQLKDALYIAGAGLFVLSDFILAWSLFLYPFGGSSYFIMVPYYLALMTFFYKAD